ncbi:MAG: archease [Candidatus Nezhaarchaeota archaeon]|nr:archease [Candidatus Nezhaarchaeota archaeon]
MSIRFLDHPADVYVEVTAETLREAFSLCGKALYRVMTDIGRVKPLEKVDVEVNGFDLHSLLYNWLEELLYLFDAKGFLGSEVTVEEIAKVDDGFRLKAAVLGEKYDPKRHTSMRAVKAATYHLMEIREGPGLCVIRFVLDI